MLEKTDKQIAKPLSWLIVVWIVIGLGAAVGVWEGAVQSIHAYNQHIVQEARAAKWVGPSAPLVKPVKIEVEDSDRFCLKVTSVRVGQYDDQNSYDYMPHDLTIFVQRICGSSGDYAEIHWKALSDNNTVIESGWTNQESISTGEKYEYDTGYTADARVAKIVVWESGLY